MKLKSLSIVLLSLCLMISACSPTTVKESWKNQQINKPLGKVMVLGVSENDPVRNAYEQKLVALLEQHGIPAVASNEVWPVGLKLKKEFIIDAAKDNAVQTIFVSRVASVKKIKETRKQVSYNPYYGSRENSRRPQGWYNYYLHQYDNAQTSMPSDVEWKLIKTHNNIYDLETEEIIWSAILESESSQPRTTIDAITSTLVEQMKKDGVL